MSSPIVPAPAAGRTPGPLTAGPPYRLIANEMCSGLVVPFLGAGASLVDRPSHSPYQPGSLFPPSGSELSALLADEVSFPDDPRAAGDLATVSSFFVERSARRTLRARLRAVFAPTYVPSALHTYLARVRRPMLIVTTNYDDILERAFEAYGRPYHLVIHPTERRDLQGMVLVWRHGESKPEPVRPNELLLDLEKTAVIYKMHGTCTRRPPPEQASGASRPDWCDHYVITEEDYVDFLARMTGQTAVPAQFMQHFYGRHFLFLGYGLRDWNLRVVLKTLQSVSSASAGLSPDEDQVRSWAVQRSPSQHECVLWDRRGVDIFDSDLAAFVRALEGDTPSAELLPSLAEGAGP
jgi:hypothetical protein